jgi:lysophospholipase L1-like esterase
MRSLLSIFLSLILPGICAAAEALPQVLVIGDSVQRSIASAAAGELKGRVKIVIPAADPGDTETAIDRLDLLLGDTKWDLIHFNFGFADLRYIDPKTKSVRAMSRHAGGVRRTSPEQYEENLRKIVGRLKATGSKLIWATTTPLMGSKADSIFEPGSEVAYNAIALRIMKQERIPISDMHSWVTENIKKHNDPFFYKRTKVHEAVIETIENALKLPPVKK